MKFLFIPLFILVTSCFGSLHGQGKNNIDNSYELYLTQIAAAEAFYQLNKISTANEYLDACDEKFRNLEWVFMKSALDQSSTTLSANKGFNYNDIKFSPDGKIIAVAGSDSVITLFSYPSLNILKELRGHKGQVITIDFSKDGEKLASGGRDHAVIIWEIGSGSIISQNNTSFSQGIYQVRFNATGNQLGVVSWLRDPNIKPNVFGFVKILDVPSAKELKKIDLDNHPAAGIVFTPDNSSMIVNTWGEIAYCYDTATDSLIWKIDYADPIEYNAFHCIDISPDGKTIALGSADHRVYLANVVDGKIIHRIEPWEGHSKTLKSVQFSPDGKWLATAGEDQTIFIWSLSDYSKKYALVGHVNTVYGMDWSADNHFVLSVSTDGTLKAWDIRNPFENKYEICDFGPWQTPLTTDKKLFAAPCSDKKLVIYEPSTGKSVSTIGEASGLCADISNDSKLLVTSSFDGVVRAWDIPTKKELKAFTGHSARVDGIVFKDNTRQILSVGDTTLRIWDLNTDKEIMIIPLVPDPFRIVLSQDEKKAFIGFNNGIVKTIDTQSWQEINSFKCENGLSEMAVSPDGKKLAIFSGKNIEIWDTGKFKLISQLSGHEKSGYGIGFSEDGDYLISGSQDQTFKMWNLATGRCTLTFHNFEDAVYSSKFLSEKEILLTSPQGMVFYYRFVE